MSLEVQVTTQNLIISVFAWHSTFVVKCLKRGPAKMPKFSGELSQHGTSMLKDPRLFSHFYASALFRAFK